MRFKSIMELSEALGSIGYEVCGLDADEYLGLGKTITTEITIKVKPLYSTNKTSPVEENNQSLLDHFAGLAMQAIITKNGYHVENKDITTEEWDKKTALCAAGAYSYADAMLKEVELRKQELKPPKQRTRA